MALHQQGVVVLVGIGLSLFPNEFEAIILSWKSDSRYVIYCVLGADIVCLQETKLEWITRGINRSIWSFPYIDWLYLGSEGASRGIFFLCGIVGLWKKWRMQWDIFSLLQI